MDIRNIVIERQNTQPSSNQKKKLERIVLVSMAAKTISTRLIRMVYIISGLTITIQLKEAKAAPTADE